MNFRLSAFLSVFNELSVIKYLTINRLSKGYHNKAWDHIVPAMVRSRGGDFFSNMDEYLVKSGRITGFFK